MEDIKTKRPFRPLVYVCSPFSGDVERNLDRTRRFCRFALESGCIPLAPHLMFPQFMPELSAKDPILGRCTVEFTAHDPFWTDTAATSKNFSSFTGGLAFPLQFEGQNIVFAIKGMSQEVYVESDVETSIRVVFSGACVRPVLRNNSIGKKIVIDTSITNGERIVVTTGYGNKNVVKVTGGGETNVNNLITDDSDFFSLRPGRNLLAFDADIGTPEITMTYRNLYTGV